MEQKGIFSLSFANSKTIFICIFKHIRWLDYSAYIMQKPRNNTFIMI